MKITRFTSKVLGTFFVKNFIRNIFVYERKVLIINRFEVRSIKTWCSFYFGTSKRFFLETIEFTANSNNTFFVENFTKNIFVYIQKVHITNVFEVRNTKTWSWFDFRSLKGFSLKTVWFRANVNQTFFVENFMTIIFVHVEEIGKTNGSETRSSKTSCWLGFGSF